jgi:putative ABC transport system permease protein
MSGSWRRDPRRRRASGAGEAGSSRGTSGVRGHAGPDAGLRGDGDVDAELRHHVDLLIEENMERGLDPESARAEALARFGDLLRIRNECEEEDRMAEREVQRHEWLTGWREDVRYGLRVLVRSPMYVLVIVATLGFGIAGIATVFSVLSPYFLRGLPYADAGSLVHLFTVNPVERSDRDRFSLAQFTDVRERAHAFSDMAAYYYSAVNLSGDDAAEQIAIGRLTANAFDVLGSKPVVGRTFEAGEDGPGGADVVVLSWGLWQRKYAGDPSIVGREVRIDGVPCTVIGVMPRDFNFPFGGVKAWVPVRQSPTTEDRARGLFLVFGRLAPTWTPERARLDLESVWRQLGTEHPDIDGLKSGIVVLGMRPALNFAWDILRVAFIALVGAVLFVLLIACANITGLGLARAAARRREVAVRAALGAPRGRLVRQFMIESAILSGLGATLGLLLASALMRVAAPIIPEDLFAIGEFRVDGLVIAVTTGITVLTAMLIGMTPALTATGVSPGDVLRDGGRSGEAGRRMGRLRGALVIGELALGLILAAGAGLMVRSLRHVSEVPLGFDPDGLLTVELLAPAAGYATAEAVQAYYDRVTEAVAALPGSAGTATTAWLPLNHETQATRYRVQGSAAATDRLPSAEQFLVSPGYLEAMHVKLLGGRDLSAGDIEAGEHVALVNRALAERDLGGAAIGSVLLLGDDEPVAWRIVGVVDDVHHSSVVSPPPPQVYVPIGQSTARRRFLVARATGDPGPYAESIRRTLMAIDPDVPANRLRPMADIVNESVGPFAAMSIVLGVFGGFALLLAAVGLYGLVSYAVTQRRSEFGIRMALGAGPRDLLRSVLGNGIRLASIGIALGLVGAVAAGRIMTSLVFGIRTADPIALGVAAAVFLATALLATALPARRASRADPLTALRAE